MELLEAKTRLERYKSTLENTVKMYEKTIREMVEKGSDPESISVVLQMKKDTENQLTEISASLRNASEKAAKGRDLVVVYNELVDKMFKAFNPFFKQRFIVDFGTDEIKDYFVESVSYTDSLDNALGITFRNSEGFFVPEYFNKKNHFDRVQVFLLNPLGEKKAVMSFYSVNVSCVSLDELNYKTDGILMSTVLFDFDHVVHETL